MPKPEDYRHIRLEVADNGLVVDYTEIVRKDSDDPLSDTIHKEHKEIFEFSEAKKAIDRVMELKGVTPKQKEKESEGSDHAEEEK